MSLASWVTSTCWASSPGAWYTLHWIFSFLALVTSAHLVLMAPSGLAAGTGYLGQHDTILFDDVYGSPLNVSTCNSGKIPLAGLVIEEDDQMVAQWPITDSVVIYGNGGHGFVAVVLLEAFGKTAACILGANLVSHILLGNIALVLMQVHNMALETIVENNVMPKWL